MKVHGLMGCRPLNVRLGMCGTMAAGQSPWACAMAAA